MTPHLNLLDKMLHLRCRNISFYAELTILSLTITKYSLLSRALMMLQCINKRILREMYICLSLVVYSEYEPWHDGMVGWLVALGFTALWDRISVYIGPSPREGGRNQKRWTREKMSKQPPLTPTASAIGPCPTIIQISRTPWHWQFTQHLRTTLPPRTWWNYIQ